MTLHTFSHETGAAPALANSKDRYWLTNDLLGTVVWLRQCSDGQFADKSTRERVGHQLVDTADGASISFDSQTGYGAWALGTKSTFVVLSPGDINLIKTPIATFASTGVLATPVLVSTAVERTLVRQNNSFRNAPPPVSNGQAVAQLEIIQGSVSVFLTQSNCSDLGSTLTTLSST
jgi:hypothetical protein